MLIGEADLERRAEGVRSIVVFDLETKRFREVMSGGALPRYLPSGHLVFGRGQTIYAMAFDLGTLSPIGRPTPVLQSVTTNRFGGPAVRFSDSGTQQVEIRPFGASGVVRQVSNAGGSLPSFSRNGRYLYYRNEAALYEVAIGVGETLELSAPRQVIQEGVPSQQNGPSESARAWPSTKR